MVKLTPFFFLSFLIISSSLAFQSDEFGLEGAQQQTPTTRKRYSDPDSDSKVHFSLEHAFGDSDFSPAGTFSARLKSWSHGGKVLSLPFSFPNPIEWERFTFINDLRILFVGVQTLTKLRFSRNGFSDEEKDTFKVQKYSLFLLFIQLEWRDNNGLVLLEPIL